ncbi:hypothetical protein, partial [Alistipes onderdonkii]|uniref:hypothetical protein n=1 Tax=Alistipes onderdonkii TaxID=328813 RepID=UPI003263B85F
RLRQGYKELQRGYNEGKTTPSKDNFFTSLRARARGNRTHETLLQVYIMNFPTSMRARERAEPGRRQLLMRVLRLIEQFNAFLWCFYGMLCELLEQ